MQPWHGKLRKIFRPMLEAYFTFIIIPSEIRRASEGLNAHELIVVIDSKFSDAYDVD